MSRLIIGSLIAVVLYTAASMAAAGQTQPGSNGSTRTDSKAPTILFMCPHGAAKSVLASAYFQRLAKERGLNVQVRSAGTDPDPHISPTVASHLKRTGYDVPVAKPRRATADDMANADVVISIGCDLKELPSPRGTLLQWDNVPSTTDEFARADERIRERVVALVDELVRKQQKR